MFCRSKFLIIPNSQGPKVLNWLVTLICRTLSITKRLFSRVFTPQKTVDIDGSRYSPDDPHYGLGPVHSMAFVSLYSSYVRLVTGASS